MPETYKCAGCQGDLERRAFHECATTTRKRPVASRCRACRRADRERRLYSEQCASCRRHRPIAASGTCLRCLLDQGFRPCRTCGALKALYLDFWGRQTSCIGCRTKPQAGDAAAIPGTVA